jgi:single-strand DNA-binding protein
MSYQKVIILGNLGRDPETKYMPDGNAVCTMSVATNKKWKDKSTGEKKELVEWWRVVLYSPLAEVAGEYLRKGSSVLLEGEMRTRKYTDKDGNERSITELRASELRLQGSTDDGPKPRSEPQPKPAPTAPSKEAKQVEFEDDIPFIVNECMVGTEDRLSRRINRNRF